MTFLGASWRVSGPFSLGASGCPSALRIINVRRALVLGLLDALGRPIRVQHPYVTRCMDLLARACPRDAERRFPRRQRWAQDVRLSAALHSDRTRATIAWLRALFPFSGIRRRTSRPARSGALILSCRAQLTRCQRLQDRESRRTHVGSRLVAPLCAVSSQCACPRRSNGTRPRDRHDSQAAGPVAYSLASRVRILSASSLRSTSGDGRSGTNGSASRGCFILDHSSAVARGWRPDWIFSRSHPGEF